MLLGVVVALIVFWDGVVVSQNLGKFIVLSDLHYAPEQGSSPPSPSDIQFGSDSPYWLINSTIYALGSGDLVPGPVDFILNTGDLCAHALSTKNNASAFSYLSQILTATDNVFSTVFGNSSSNKYAISPILALGNNDLYPKYAAPGTTPQWLASLASQWPSLNYDTNAQQSFLQNGAYTIDVPTGSTGFIRIIVLHTNYWSASNTYTTNDDDPAGLFALLQTQLQQAQQDGAKVYIMGHIPPGIDHFGLTPQWQSRFVDTYLGIVVPYLGTTILAQLFGHEHVALFRLMGLQQPMNPPPTIVEPEQKISSFLPAYEAGPVHLHSSISPVYDNYPSFREYTYDRDTGELLDFATWYLDFSNSTNPVWQLQFASAKTEFGIANLEASGFCSLVRNMYSDSTLFNLYVQNSYSFSPDFAACDSTCQAQALCNAQFLTLSNYTNCVQNNVRLPCAIPPTTGSTGASTATTTTSGRPVTSASSSSDEGRDNGTIIVLLLLSINLLLACSI